MITESGSSLGTYLACPKKHEFKYLKGYESPSYAKALVLGSLLHEYVEAYNSKKPTDGSLIKELQKKFPKNSYEIERESDLAYGMFKAWRSYWEEINFTLSNRNLEFIDVEAEWSMPINDKYTLVGKRDGYLKHSDGRHYLYELKTASSRDKDGYVRALESNAQITNNILALINSNKPVDGVIYDIIWKPAIRQKKHEEDKDFHERYIDEYSDGDKYFTRLTMYKKSSQLDEHLLDLKGVVTQMDSIKPYRNPNGCQSYNQLCPYFDACMDSNDEMLIGFTKRDKKHMELSEEYQGEN